MKIDCLLSGGLEGEKGKGEGEGGRRKDGIGYA